MGWQNAKAVMGHAVRACVLGEKLTRKAKSSGGAD